MEKRKAAEGRREREKKRQACGGVAADVWILDGAERLLCNRRPLAAIPGSAPAFPKRDGGLLSNLGTPGISEVKKKKQKKKKEKRWRAKKRVDLQLPTL